MTTLIGHKNLQREEAQGPAPREAVDKTGVIGQEEHLLNGGCISDGVYCPLRAQDLQVLVCDNAPEVRLCPLRKTLLHHRNLCGEGIEAKTAAKLQARLDTQQRHGCRLE